MIAIAFLLSFFAFSYSYVPSHASGDVNVDSGGGSLGVGSSSNYWSSGRDGVRITVVRASDGAVMSTPIDFSNGNNSDVEQHFGAVSKIQYVSGTGLSIVSSEYQSYQFGMSLPRIVTSEGYTTDIEEIRDFFRDKNVIEEIANMTGISYDTLTNGTYKLLMEPIVYLVFSDVTYAMTATEAALFDQMGSGILRSSFVSLSHKNLPLSMFLETSDLGFPAWSGANEAQGNTTIISSLGIGIIQFSEEEVEAAAAYDVTYRTDTDVITSVTVSSAVERNPEDPVTVEFSINGSVTSNADYTDFTNIGNTISYFPEFGYTYYCRLLEPMSSGLSGYFEFYNNKYSTFNERLYFTPVWFQDGAYTPIAVIRDAWTPAGELKVQLADTIIISGSVYDDWHVKPVLTN